MIPSSRSSRASVTIAWAARRSGSRSVICDPTWMWSPTISSAVAAGEARRADLARRVAGDPELVGLQPGRDVRMAARVDVGIDPERHPGARLPFAREEIDPLELTLRFRIDGLDPEIDRLRQLRRRSCRRR